MLLASFAFIVHKPVCGPSRSNILATTFSKHWGTHNRTDGLYHFRWFTGRNINQLITSLIQRWFCIFFSDLIDSDRRNFQANSLDSLPYIFVGEVFVSNWNLRKDFLNFDW